MQVDVACPPNRYGTPPPRRKRPRPSIPNPPTSRPAAPSRYRIPRPALDNRPAAARPVKDEAGNQSSKWMTVQTFQLPAGTTGPFQKKTKWFPEQPISTQSRTQSFDRMPCIWRPDIFSSALSAGKHECLIDEIFVVLEGTVCRRLK